ncbi:MAG: helix-turn-helix domain-containing protein [Acidimicrobiales bacterium]
MAELDDIDLAVSRRLRELRRDRGLTLSSLSEQTGISGPHLSRLEKGERQPSIGALLQLARAYGVSVSQLVEEREDEDIRVMRGQDAAVHRGRDGAYTVLSGPRGVISVVRVELSAGKPATVARHAGEEWLHVLAGAVRVTIEERKLVLEAGDSVQFDSSRDHRLAAAGRRSATVLIASTAAAVPARHPIPARDSD